jgi:hypothetical protein
MGPYRISDTAWVQAIDHVNEVTSDTYMSLMLNSLLAEGLEVHIEMWEP